MNGPDPFKDVYEIDLLAPEVSRQHGAAAYHYGWNVEPEHGHKHSGYYFVAVADHDEAVKGVGHGHYLYGIGYEFPGNKGIFHSLVIHCKTVTYSNHWELHWCSACCEYSFFNSFNNWFQTNMSRYDFIVSAYYTYDWLLDLTIGHAQCF